ncbi:hypothetical protein ACS0TY_016553 [Phlomoides rotata]
MAKPLGPIGEFFRRRDEWRKHPMLHKQWRHGTPGLDIGLVAFGIYLIGETAYDKNYAPKSHSHSHSTSSASHNPISLKSWVCSKLGWREMGG